VNEKFGGIHCRLDELLVLTPAADRYLS